MIVALYWQYHDYERQLFVIDTDKLDLSNPFFKDLKVEIEKEEQYGRVHIDGNKYDNDEDIASQPEEAMIELPATVEKFLDVLIDFEG